MKTKIAMSLLVIAVTVSMLVGSTLAYFSDTATASNNTFTAGTLNIQISNGGDYADSLNGVWETQTGWAPGDTKTATLSFTNVGSIDAKHVYFYFSKSGSDLLMDKIIVTSIQERFNSTDTDNQLEAAAATLGNKDGVLTLNELVSVNWYSWDDKTGDGVILQAGDKKDYAITFTFLFPADAGNEYQGLSASFDLCCEATQNSPTDDFVPVHR